MFLKHKPSGNMIDVVDMHDLTNLFHQQVSGRFQCGEEQQDIEMFDKGELSFLSGEELPQCWTDPNYRK